jgi:hypothetical protein
MMKSSFKERETPGLVTALLNALKALLESPETFLISNESLLMLFSLYEKDLLQAVSRGEGVDLLTEWQNESESFRAAWMGFSIAAITDFNPGGIRVVTESGTRKASQECARRKQSKNRRR